jgi:hypothetical protein
MIHEEQRKKYLELKLRRQKESSSSETNKATSNVNVHQAGRPDDSHQPIQKIDTKAKHSTENTEILSRDLYLTRKRFMSDDYKQLSDYDVALLDKQLCDKISMLKTRIDTAIGCHHYEEADQMNSQLLELESYAHQSMMAMLHKSRIEHQKVSIEMNPIDQLI